MECPLGDNRKTLQEPYVTVTPEECDSSTFEKLSKNVFHTMQWWEWVVSDPKWNSKVVCPLGNNKKILQWPCVTVIQ